MNIKYCPIEGGNFGDTLNTMVWDRLFPDLTLHKEDMLVYGIGTLLDGRHDQSRKKIVLGSGIGEAHAAMPDPNWDFRWVRGPLSAQEFGLPSELALRVCVHSRLPAGSTFMVIQLYWITVRLPVLVSLTPLTSRLPAASNAARMA